MVLSLFDQKPRKKMEKQIKTNETLKKLSKNKETKNKKWFCKNWKIAGVAIRAKDAQLPTDLVVQLQRCSGFSDKSVT
jgi:flagellar motility protein MotE (MotC chaperone)